MGPSQIYKLLHSKGKYTKKKKKKQKDNLGNGRNSFKQCNRQGLHGLMPQIYKQLIQLDSKNKNKNKKKTPNRKMGINRHFSKEDIDISPKKTYGCPTGT